MKSTITLNACACLFLSGAGAWAQMDYRDVTETEQTLRTLVRNSRHAKWFTIGYSSNYRNDPNRPARLPIDINVDKPPHRAHFVVLIPEQPDRIDDAAGAEPFDGQPGVNRIRKAHRTDEAAARFGDDADRGELADVDAGRLEQVSVHRGVEERVIRDVVDVAVVVVVHPARGDRAQDREVATARKLDVSHGDRVLRMITSCGRRASPPLPAAGRRR